MHSKRNSCGISLNRVPFGAGMSQCTTCQEWAKLSKGLPCSMVGIVIDCAESENEAEVGQKNKKNICTTRQLHNEGLRHYLIRWCTYETTITEPPFCNLSLSVFFYFFFILISLWNYRDLGEMTVNVCLFYLEIFYPLFIVIACRWFWTHLFVICGNAPSCWIQSPTARLIVQKCWERW